MPQAPAAQPASAGVMLWSWLLLSPIPWVGQALQRQALAQLRKTAQAGDLAAATTLGSALDLAQTAALRIEIEQALSAELPPMVSDHLWEYWSATRRPGLAACLSRRGITARPHSSTWVLSQAFLGRLGPLKGAAPARIAALTALLDDNDPQISDTALAALAALSLSESRDELARLWAESRSIRLWQILSAAGYIPTTPPGVVALFYLKTAAVDVLLHSSACWVPGLVAAITDPDPEIATQALRCLPYLQNEAAINHLAEIWQGDRSPRIKEILLQGGLLATQPYELRLLTALLGHPELAAQAVPQGIPTLLKAATDRDPHLAAAARSALLNLTHPKTRSELCLVAIQQNETAAFEIALQAGYRPELPQQRALFLFLSGLWTEYNSLDFDHRLLQAVFSASSPELRQRIALQVQRSGQTDYLTILAGPDLRSRAHQLSAGETELVADLLLSNQEWPRLWSFIQTFSFAWSVRILQALQSAGWRPDTASECSELEHLLQYSSGMDLPTRTSFSQSLPPAVPSAVVKVQGRVNDICFAPKEPLIVIGTGSRKLAVWNFQQAKLKQVRQGFNHSISRVAYAGSDFLLCGVRSNTDAACLIYGWQQDEAFVLPGHIGAVTALLPVAENNLLSTGRDGAVILWNLASRQEIHRQTVPEWPRSALLLPDQQQVALLHSSITLLQLPNLAEVAIQPFWTRSSSNTQRAMAQCALFPPNYSGFLIGQRNGQVVHCEPSRTGRKIVRKAILWEKAPIIELAYLARQHLLVSAVQNGMVRFHSWPSLLPVGYVTAPQGHLTSLQISADGAFMATGTSESSMLLWDLRALDLPDLVDLPLSKATPEHLAAVTGLLSSPGLPIALLRPLELLKALLLRRFRFDIHLDDLPKIQPGEFDILLD